MTVMNRSVVSCQASPLRNLLAAVAATATVVVLASSGLAVSLAGQSAASLPDGLFDDLTYRHIGPVGNRVSAVVGVPGNPQVYYFGAASGGVWKTEDGGLHWDPVFDDQPVQSIGAMAVAPSDPNVVYVGTGEAHIRSNVSRGNGVYRTTDGGDSWAYLGLEQTGRIGRIRIHPNDPDVAYVAALGHLYGPQEERGVYRTTDGGRTWERVLFIDQDTGVYDIEMNPANPRILFATGWTMLIRTWGRWSGGPGSGIYRSTDGGTTWTRLEGSGLPTGTLGKIGLGTTAADPDRVYALIETNANRDFGPVDPRSAVLWRSDDGGDSWQAVNWDHALTQRPLYYTRVVAAPDDRNEVHFLATSFHTSLDGGRTFERGDPGGDHHDMWIDPLMPDRMIVGHDQGVSISADRGDTWMRPRLPIAQMYHGITDRQIPYRVYGNRQDGPSISIPSNSLTGGSIPIGLFQTVGGCESGFAVPDIVDTGVVWSGCYEGILDRHDMKNGHSRTVSVWPDNPEGWPAGELRYRFQWTFPVHVSPHDHNRVYAGSQHVHRTTDGGQSWEVISPDLTTNDKTKQEKTGGLTPDDSSPTYAAVLFAIAESPLEEGVIWAGSNDGLVHVTRNGGTDWANVTANIPGLPEWGTISNIEPSPHAAGTAYVSVDFHQVGINDPYVYRTTDYGRSWTRITNGIPAGTHSYVHVVREDPKRQGLLYAGTENALYVSFDDGASWSPLQTNLPHAPVHWLEIQPDFDDLVVATYGRGFWILDDVTPVQQLTPDVLAADAHLFQPRPAYRFIDRASAQSQPEDPGAGTNPEYGATLHLYAGQGAARSASVEIVAAGGTTVRTLDTRLSPGLNRIQWDLREEASRTPKLRTQPLEHEHVAFNDEGWRALGEGGRVRPLAPPGTYTVRVTAGDWSASTELVVLRDPASEGTEAEIAEQVAMMRELRAETDAVVDLIDEIEWIRKSIDDIEARVAAGARTLSQEDADRLLARARTLDQELIDLEMLLFDLRLTGGAARQDTLRWPRRLYAKLTSLGGYVSGTDHRPTDQAREVHAIYKDQLTDYQQRMEGIRAGALADFNRLLAAAGVAVIS